MKIWCLVLVLFYSVNVIAECPNTEQDSLNHPETTDLSTQINEIIVTAPPRRNTCDFEELYPFSRQNRRRSSSIWLIAEVDQNSLRSTTGSINREIQYIQTSNIHNVSNSGLFVDDDSRRNEVNIKFSGLSHAMFFDENGSPINRRLDFEFTVPYENTYNANGRRVDLVCPPENCRAFFNRDLPGSTQSNIPDRRGIILVERTNDDGSKHVELYVDTIGFAPVLTSRDAQTVQDLEPRNNPDYERNFDLSIATNCLQRIIPERREEEIDDELSNDECEEPTDLARPEQDLPSIEGVILPPGSIN